MEEQHKPDPELQRLDFLVGTWQTSGTVRATLSAPALEIKGTDTYEWTLGGFFLLHRVAVLMGEQKTEVMELIGYDASSRTYPMRSFDQQGNFTTMQASIGQDGVMKIAGDKMRSRLTAGRDGQHMTAHWERSEDGSAWLPWMEMQFHLLPYIQ